MAERLERSWRVLASGLCFAVFGLGGLVLGLLGAPLLVLRREPAARTRAARTVVRRFFRFFLALTRALGVLTWEVHGAERLQRPGLLILANHPTLIDVIFILSLVEQSGCLVKSALARNPFTRGAVRVAGYITNDAGVELVEACRQRLEAGESLLIFPEGTRTPANGQVALRRGAANVAVRCRHDITPVTIRCVPRSLAKGQKWYQVPPRRMHFTIQVHPDLSPGPFLAASAAEPVAVRRLNEHLSRFFQQESGLAAA